MRDARLLKADHGAQHLHLLQPRHPVSVGSSTRTISQQKTFNMSSKNPTICRHQSQDSMRIELQADHKPYILNPSFKMTADTRGSLLAAEQVRSYVRCINLSPADRRTSSDMRKPYLSPVLLFWSLHHLINNNPECFAQDIAHY